MKETDTPSVFLFICAVLILLLMWLFRKDDGDS
jgi:hypothetical protein